MKHKKAVIDGLANLVTTLGALAILLAIIFLMIAETKTQIIDINPCHNTSHFYNATQEHCQAPGLIANTSFSTAYNATSEVQSATADIPGWLPIIVITVIGGLLLILVKFFKQK